MSKKGFKLSIMLIALLMLLSTLIAPVQARITSIEGTATYYHPSLQDGTMRDEVTKYDREASGLVAATSWPIGTILEVEYQNKWLIVEVRDTGYLPDNHVDLSEADFQVLAGCLDPGIISVLIRVWE